LVAVERRLATDLAKLGADSEARTPAPRFWGARDGEVAFAEGFAKTRIAAVGPVVMAAVQAAGGTVAIAPADNFHMRSMVNAILDALG